MTYSKHPERVMEELAKDFETELNKIDFSNYDPATPDFMRPLSIGLLWFVLHRAEMPEKDLHEISVEKDDISEEISGASHYLTKYRETGQEAYLEMARDELKHARMLSGLTGDLSHTREIDNLQIQL